MIYHFNHPEWITGLPKPDLEAASGNIIVYGTEMCGALASHALKQKGLSFSAYADSDHRKHGETYYEHIILSPEQLWENHPNAIILIASSAYKPIHTLLISLGFADEQIFPCFLIFDGVDLDGFESPWSKEHITRGAALQTILILRQMGVSMEGNIYRLVLYPTDRCNLRCKECRRRIPEIENPRDFDLDKMILSVDNIIKSGFYIDHIIICGGEPFLYNKLAELLNALASYSNIYRIHIITNATLLPTPNLLKALKNEKIIVRISNYGEISAKLNELVTLFQDNQVTYEDTKHSFWWKVAEWKTLKETPEQLQARFNHCGNHMSEISVVEGKAYICNTAAFADQRNWIRIPENECVNLLDTSITVKEELDELLNRNQYHSACQYCLDHSYNDNLERVPVAEQLP